MSTALAATSNGPTTWAYMGDDIDAAGRLAKALCATGLAPNGMTPGQAFYILLAGREIGVRGPIEALRHIVVVKGKPTMSAELMRAFMLAAGCRLEWLRQDDRGASLKVTRPDGSTGTFSFLEPDAQRAGLLKSGSAWTSYPAAMYAARATSIAARLFCPDMVRGATYTPEELGAAVVVTDDGGEHAALPPAPPEAAPAPHVDAAATPEVPEAEGSTAGAGDAIEDALPLDVPEGGPLPAPVSGPDPSTEAVPDRLSTTEVDSMVLFLAGKLGISTSGGPVSTLVAVEEKMREKRAPYSSGQIDQLTHDQAKALMTWAKKNGGAK